MHPLVFIGTWLTALMILVSSFSVPNMHFLPVNITYNSLTTPVKKQIECLAENIYFEAGNETDSGKVAVAMVTMNRVASRNYADDICSVVYQKTKVSDKVVCQFSWTCQVKEMSNRLTIKQSSLYNDIRELSVRVYMNYGKIEDVTKGATYYHADYVNPGWNLPKTTKIGRHIFYKKHSDSINLNKEI
jgi:spore germination cell wall hydrolase CwlJ-like protein